MVSGGDEFPNARKRLGRCFDFGWVFVFAMAFWFFRKVILRPLVRMGDQGPIDRDCDDYRFVRQCRFDI